MSNPFLPTVYPLGTVGYQTDLPRQVRTLTHYEEADNCLFEPGAQIRKFGGAAKINTVAMTDAVTGMYDFHFGGGPIAFDQKFIAVTADGKIYKEDMDGVFDDITGAASIAAGAIPVFTTANDYLVIAFSTSDLVLKWDGITSTVSTLNGLATGRGSVFHANRLWVWTHSELFYSAYGDPTDFTTDTGSFVFDIKDGDHIVGCVSYKKNLIVCKGPNKGKIFVISGSDPEGDDAFSKNLLVTGVALQSPNAIVPVGDDIALMSDRGVHLLTAVQQFGNFAQKDITRFLRRHFREKLNRNNFPQIWGVNYQEGASLLWATSRVATPTVGNDQLFGISYGRLEEDGWKAFTVTRECSCLAIRKNPTTKIDEIVTGDQSGFVWRQDVEARNIDTDTAYALNLVSPAIIIGVQDVAGTPRADQPVELERAYVRCDPVGDYVLNAFITRNNLPADEYQFHLGNSGNFILDESILDEDTIGDGNTGIQIAYTEPRIIGQCRTFKFQLAQAGLNQDASLIEMGIEHVPVTSTELPLIEKGS